MTVARAQQVSLRVVSAAPDSIPLDGESSVDLALSASPATLQVIDGAAEMTLALAASPATLETLDAAAEVALALAASPVRVPALASDVDARLTLSVRGLSVALAGDEALTLSLTAAPAARYTSHPVDATAAVSLGLLAQPRAVVIDSGPGGGGGAFLIL